MRCRSACCLAILALLHGAGARLSADDFRMETKVFAGDAEEPQSTNVTLFSVGRVYDFQDEPAEVTIYDPQGAVLILLDSERKVRTEIKVTELLEFGARQQAWAVEQSEPLVRFAAAPQFQKTDDGAGVYTWTSDAMTYVATTAKAKSQAAAAQYREFGDLSARLNAFTRPGAPPPLPRLQINAEMAEAGLMPQQVRLAMPRQRLGDKAQTFRSEHRTMWRLSEADLKRIDQAGKMLVTFPLVSPRGYFDPSLETASQ